MINTYFFPCSFIFLIEISELELAEDELYRSRRIAIRSRPNYVKVHFLHMVADIDPGMVSRPIEEHYSIISPPGTLEAHFASQMV